MIQEIYPQKMNNQFAADPEKKADDIILCFKKRDVLCRFEGDMLILPTRKDFKADIKDIYLFSIDEQQYFYCEDFEDRPEGTWNYIFTWELRHSDLRNKVNMHAIFTGVQLAGWYKDNKYCGTCGHETVPATDERAMVCTHCRRRIYPRILPAVIIGITNGDKFLLTKYADRPLATHALVAGFTEIGETLEETVAREVEEEVGLRVKNIRYYKSQPWGVVDDILMGFFCDVDGRDDVRIDEKELKIAEWFYRKDIPYKLDDISLTNDMIIAFKEGREPK